jgi:hypothetical protein
MTADDERASVDWIGDLDPKAVSRLQQGADEALRRDGRLRELVLRMLARGDEPARDDLAAAVEEAPGAPVPKEVAAYAARVIRARLPLKPGRKAPPRATWEEIVIKAHFQRALQQATKAHEEDDSPRTGAVKARALKATATAFKISTRTIERIIAPRRWLKRTPPK